MAFQPGKSGNPAGRPRGIEDKRAEFRRLLGDRTPAVIEKVITMALAGDPAAMRLVLERTCPPMRPREEPMGNFDLLGKGLAERAESVIQAASDGQITLDAAEKLMALPAAQARLQELPAILQRLEALEARLSK